MLAIVVLLFLAILAALAPVVVPKRESRKRLIQTIRSVMPEWVIDIAMLFADLFSFVFNAFERDETIPEPPPEGNLLDHLIENPK